MPNGKRNVYFSIGGVRTKGHRAYRARVSGCYSARVSAKFEDFFSGEVDAG